MSTAPAEPTPTEPTTQEPPAAAATPVFQAPAAAGTPPAAPEESGLPDDPEALRGIIRDLRKENAKKRTEAPSAEAKRAVAKQAAEQATEQARQDLAQTIGKALGLVKDEPIDPAKLTESLTQSQAEAKQARVELAVFRSAATAGGDPAALLDSSSFLKSLDAIDPADSAAVEAAVKAAVEANPRLGAAPAGPRPPAPNPAQGTSGAGSPSLDDQIAEKEKAGDILGVIALKQARAAQTKKP